MTKRYGDSTILNELDLHIPSGRFGGGGPQRRRQKYPAAPAGGSGKTNAGELLAGATPTAAIQDDTRMMFQDARLLPWKAVIDGDGAGAKKALARPCRPPTSVGQRSDNRTGVAGRAVGWAEAAARCAGRALIHRPRLLLDEPLGALDALTRLEMQELIASPWQEHGFTVLRSRTTSVKR
ncbi:hypothetical protein MJ579_10545 [Klebsiella pneumoniae]|nr:hypothetical protein MJ579_10545 [Klebsiella pneumoniae]